MQGLHRRVLLAVAVAFTATGASAQYSAEPDPRALSGGDHRYLLREEAVDARVPAAWFRPAVHHVNGANFVKLHFSRFNLPEGVYVEISNPSGTESWRYSGNSRDPYTVDELLGDDGSNSFWSMSITGDTAIVRLMGKLARFDPMHHFFDIDTHYSDAVTSVESRSKSKGDGIDPSLESNCGESELYDAVCWAGSHPDHYDRSSPVAMIITTSGKKCTAWRAGSENRMFTARHCLATQAELDGAEIWFDYQSSVCGGESVDPVKVTGGELLSQDYKLDYALFTVDGFDLISGFGNLGLDIRDGNLGEKIFIPQHGLGNPKQIAIASDMNVSGLCEIDDNDMDGYIAGSDVGYMCDTTTSSSGSPVISGVTGRAIALHHWGGCFNSGTKMSYIWSKVSEFFDGVPKGNADGDWAEANKAPIARIKSSCDSLSCEFYASASTDSDGSIVAWDWQIEGQSLPGKTVAFDFPKAGEYEVTLTVTDDEGASDTAETNKSVTVPNEAPTAKFSTTCVENACTFDAGGSSDPDGAIVSWSWDLGDGAKASGDTVEHAYGEAGSYPVKLTVEDDGEATDSSSFTVTVTMPNDKPDAAFTVSCDELSCAVDAGASTDPDGEVVSYVWNFGDGHEASGSTAEHLYGKDGKYTIVLVVEDNDGAKVSKSKQVTVETPNEAPVASFTADCKEGLCRFDAAASEDSDGFIIKYHWALGDGSTATGSTVEHQYKEDGNYTVRLVVTDNRGAKGSRSRTYSVTLPVEKPVAWFTVNCDGRVCALDAGSSTASGASISDYTWAFGDGSTGKGGTVTHEYAEDGVYIVTLKVTDSNSASGVRNRTIEVEAPEELILEAQLGSGKNQALVSLSWTGANEAVNVYRSGTMIATVNGGSWSDSSLKSAGATANYRVCDTDGKRCSNTVKLYLGK